MIQNMLKNWKTTSMGLSTIIGVVVGLVFAVKAGKADATVWTVALTAILPGIGLLFSRDASAAAADHAESKTLIAAVDNKLAASDTKIAANTADISANTANIETKVPKVNV
jgi:hypothetical protein